MKYWRFGVKANKEDRHCTLIYFATEQLDDIGDVADMLEDFGFYTVNCYAKHLSAFEFFCNACFYPIATINSCLNHKNAIIIA